MGCAVLATVFIGFAPTFYLRESSQSLPMRLQVHGFVFSAWLVLFIVQTGLIAAGRVDLHRRLGIAGAILALAMLGLGTLTALRSVAGASDPGALAFLAIPLFDMVVFAVLVGSALALRHVAQTHKRLMLIAMIGLLTPATGRIHWPAALRGTFSDYVVPDLFLVPLVVWDLATRRRLHPATIFGGALLIASQFIRVKVSYTATWQHLAQWLVN